MQLVLSLFPGGGLLDMAFEEAIIRNVLTTMRQKYPAYEPSDAVKQEIRERVK